MRPGPRRLLPGLLALFPLAAAAGQPYLDVYDVPSARLNFTVPVLGSGDDDGDGYGLKGWLPIGEAGALTGEYQKSSYDDTGFDLDLWRVGLGLTGETRSGVYAEYLNLDLDGSKASGYAAQLRLEGLPDVANVYLQAGYLALSGDDEDLRGPEYLGGVAFPINSRTGGFVDYRRTRLTGRDSDVAYRFTDIRAGIRLSF